MTPPEASEDAPAYGEFQRQFAVKQELPYWREFIEDWVFHKMETTHTEAAAIAKVSKGRWSRILSERDITDSAVEVVARGLGIDAAEVIKFAAAYEPEERDDGTEASSHEQ